MNSAYRFFGKLGGPDGLFGLSEVGRGNVMAPGNWTIIPEPVN